MQIHNLQQGTPEWDALRANHYTASEAPVIMGESPYMTRQDLIRYKAGVCETAEITRFQESLFANGHEAEAKARAITERQIDDDLYPITATETVEGLPLLASLDGVDEDHAIKFEHKLINDKLRQMKTPDDLSPLYYWQLEHQDLVVPCLALFVASDGTENERIEIEYQSRPERRAELIAAWKQFDADLKAFKENPKPEPAEKPEGQKAAAFPVLSVQLTGQVTETNLPEFKEQALAQIAAIKTELTTDQDFADAEVMVKALKAAESQIEDVKRQALAQTASIEDLFNAMDEVREAARQARLNLDKSVKAQKETLRINIANKRQELYAEHVNSLQASINGVTVTFDAIDPLIAMKGKKTIKSLEDAADQALADGKLAANELADLVRTNLTFAEAEASDYRFLFSDMAQLALKAADDFQAVVKARVAEHKEAERIKAERAAQAEQERIDREKATTEQAVDPVASGPVHAPAPQKQASQPEINQEAVSRPTDWQIVEALADYYQTDKDTVIGWLCELDLSELEAAA